MAHRDRIRPGALRSPREELVSGLARRLLGAHRRAALPRAHDALDARALAVLANEARVGRRLGAAQAVVEVGADQLWAAALAQRAKGVEQRQRVLAAGYGDDQPRPGEARPAQGTRDRGPCLADLPRGAVAGPRGRHPLSGR